MKKIGTVAGASIAAFAVGATLAGGLTIATADSDSTSGTPAAQGYGPGPMGHRGGPGEIVTGEDAQKAIDAALAAVPGTADHVHKDADGNYLVMVTTSENTRVVVVLDSTFAVIDQREMPAGRPGGPGHGPGTPATEEQTQKATDAVPAEYPKATVLHVFVRDGEGYAVMMRTDTGKKKVALLDEDYTITSVEKPRERGRHGKRDHFGKDVTGPNFKKAEAAALEKFPNGTVMDVHRKGKKFYAMVEKENGTMVIVVMNSDFEVTNTRAMEFPRRHQQPTATSTAA